MIGQKEAQSLIGATKHYTWDELCRTIDVLYDRIEERDAHLKAAQNTIEALEGILKRHGIDLQEEAQRMEPARRMTNPA